MKRLEERVRDGAPSSTWTEKVLSGASALFGAAVGARERFYRSGLARVHRAGRPVVSVGNLTVGGTGKTPVVHHLARALLARGFLPAVLLRGYGPSPREPKLAFREQWQAVGDEAALLSSWLPGVPVIACRDRVRGAHEALALAPALDLFLLDDGFQHRRLARDLDVVLIDATDPWGGGRLLPAGRLREPVSALSRARAVVLTRVSSEEGIEELRREVARLSPGALFAAAEVRPFGLVEVATALRLPLERLEGASVLAVAGIGRPAAFAASLERLGARVELAAFRDHHAYTSRDIEDLVARAAGRPIVTTEKDAVRWPGDPPAELWIVQAALYFREGERALLDAVLDLASRSTCR